MVLGILIETVDGIGYKTAQCHEESGRECLVHIGSETAEMNVAAEGKTYVEATAHETSKEGYGETLRKVEVLDCCLLFFL